jgi:hypothetical protein
MINIIIGHQPNHALNSDPAAGRQVHSLWYYNLFIFANQFGSGWAG